VLFNTNDRQAHDKAGLARLRLDNNCALVLLDD
jgi:hypothetical protein